MMHSYKFFIYFPGQEVDLARIVPLTFKNMTETAGDQGHERRIGRLGPDNEMKGQGPEVGTPGHDIDILGRDGRDLTPQDHPGKGQEGKDTLGHVQEEEIGQGHNQGQFTEPQDRTVDIVEPQGHAVDHIEGQGHAVDLTDLTDQGQDQK